MANQKPITTTLTMSKMLLNGISIQCPQLQDTTVGWAIQSLSKSKTKYKFPLRSANVILFGSHRKNLALKFLQQATTQLTLLEGTQHDASVQREFAAKYLIEQQHNIKQTYDNETSNKLFSSNQSTSTSELMNVNGLLYSMPTLLMAYHASAKDLLVPSKSKPYNEKFLKKVFLPDVEFFAQAGIQEDEIDTLAIGCLASPALQMSLLNSLYKQWIVYLYYSCNKLDNKVVEEDSQEKSDRRIQSVYKISDFTLITFLHSTSFAHLICGKSDPILATKDSKSLKFDDSNLLWFEPTQVGMNLDFYAKSHRHFSFIFNFLFEVKLLNGWQGFSIDCFTPKPPEFKEIKSLTEKLNKVGLRRNEFYAIQIRPRNELELQNLFSSIDIDLLMDSEEIFQLAFWMIELTPVLRGSKPCFEELAKVFESYDISIKKLDGLFSDKRLVNTIRPHEFFVNYPKIRHALCNGRLTSELLGNKYLAFRDQFLKSIVRDYVD